MPFPAVVRRWVWPAALVGRSSLGVGLHLQVPDEYEATLGWEASTIAPSRETELDSLAAEQLRLQRASSSSSSSSSSRSSSRSSASSSEEFPFPGFDEVARAALDFFDHRPRHVASDSSEELVEAEQGIANESAWDDGSDGGADSSLPDSSIAAIAAEAATAATEGGAAPSPPSLAAPAEAATVSAEAATDAPEGGAEVSTTSPTVLGVVTTDATEGWTNSSLHSLPVPAEAATDAVEGGFQPEFPNPVVPAELTMDTTEGGSFPQASLCDRQLGMSLAPSKLLYSNLGNHGPNLHAREGMLFRDVFPGLRGAIDLEVTTQTAYSPAHPAKNIVSKGFAAVNVDANTSVKLRFRFMDRANGTLAQLPEDFLMSFVSYDPVMASPGGSEEIAISNFRSYMLSEDSEISAMVGPSGHTVFTSNRRLDSPHPGLARRGPLHLTMKQRQRSLSAVLKKEDPQIQVRFSAVEGWSSRQFFFTGATNAVCPEPATCASFQCPKDHVPKPGNADGLDCEGMVCKETEDLYTCCTLVATPQHPRCDTMQCPSGFGHRRDAHSRLCAGFECGEDAGDAYTCCTLIDPVACSQERRLTFLPGSLHYSNLGGQGPDTWAPHGIMLSNVFPESGHFVDLKITNVSKYVPHDAAMNHLMGNFISINVERQTFVDLRFSFHFSNLSNEAHFLSQKGRIAQFYFNVQPRDAAATSDGIPVDGKVSVLASGFSFYNLSQHTDVEVQAAPGSKMAFTMPTPPPSGGNMALSLEGVTGATMVSLVYEDVTQFDITLQPLEATTGHNMLLGGRAGQSNACHRKASCASFTCPFSYTKKPHPSLLTCEGVECEEDADLDKCCDRELAKTCEDNEALTLSCEGVLLSNLGGQDDTRKPHNLIYGNVFPGSDQLVDLVISNLSMYQTGTGGNTGIYAGHGVVQLAANSTTTLRFRFVHHGTNRIFRLAKPVQLSFLIVRQNQWGGSPQQIRVSGYDSYTVHPHTRVRVNGSIFSGSVPHTVTEAGAAISLLHKQATSVTDVIAATDTRNMVTFVVSQSAMEVSLQAAGEDDTIFAFRGQSALMCPPRGSCATFQCPAGFSLTDVTPLPECHGQFCEDVDVTTCCMPEACADDRTFFVDDAKLMDVPAQSMVSDPQNGIPVVRLRNVFPKSGLEADLIVSALQAYEPWNASVSGVDGKYLSLNVGPGEAVDFRLKFVHSSNNSRFEAWPFFFTVMDLNQPTDTMGKGEVVISPAPQFCTTHPKNTVEVLADNRFSSTDIAPVDMLEGHPRTLADQFLQHSVTCFLNSASDFSLALSSSDVLRGRRFRLAGSSALTCPWKAGFNSC